MFLHELHSFENRFLNIEIFRFFILKYKIRKYTNKKKNKKKMYFQKCCFVMILNYVKKVFPKTFI